MSKLHQELSRLEELMPPPPGVKTEIDWEQLSKDIGAPLPESFRLFCEAYGPGTINRYLWVFHPSACVFANVASIFRRELQNRIDQNDDVDLIPALDANQLLPIGGGDNAEIILWLMEGSPNEWKLFLCDGKSYFHHSKETSLIQFIVSLLEKSSPILDRAIAADWFDNPEYIPPE